MNKERKQESKNFSKEVTLAAKGIAVVLMLIHHLFVCCPELAEQYGSYSFVFRLDQIYQISTLSKICVAVFVFLTAYGMSVTANGRKPDPSRRLKKLLPSFWVVYAAAILTSFLRADHLGLYLVEGRFKALIYMLLDAMGLSSMTGTPIYNETWWYMTLALFLIFLVPIFAAMYDRFGLCFLGAAALLPYLGMQMNAGTTYLFTAALGVWAAGSDIFAVLKRTAEKKTVFLPLAGCVLLFVLASMIRLRIGLVYWTDALLAFLLVTGLYLVIDCAGLKLRICAFVGKHSMNIFLVHTLIFEYYFTKYIYGPRHWLLSTLLLLVSSLAVSLVLTPVQDRVQKMLTK